MTENNNDYCTVRKRARGGRVRHEAKQHAGRHVIALAYTSKVLPPRLYLLNSFRIELWEERPRRGEVLAQRATAQQPLLSRCKATTPGAMIKWLEPRRSSTANSVIFLILLAISILSCLKDNAGFNEKQCLTTPDVGPIKFSSCFNSWQGTRRLMRFKQK
jgi:hypothetical protein